MEFTVPQFINREPKIVGPFTFKQFVFLGSAGVICLLLYFTLGVKFFFVFIFLSVVIIGGTLGLIFIKIKGISLPVILKNAFVFLFKPKVYLWKKKNLIIRQTPIQPMSAILPEEKSLEGTSLKIFSKSRLKDLSTKLESRQR